MSEKVTKFDSCVNGYKVISSTTTTVTLESGVVVYKEKCRLISVDTVAGVTYYRHDDE